MIYALLFIKAVCSTYFRPLIEASYVLHHMNNDLQYVSNNMFFIIFTNYLWFSAYVVRNFYADKLNSYELQQNNKHL